MTALEKIEAMEAANKMKYSARTLGLNNRDATEISCRRVECGPGGKAVSPTEFVETIGTCKTEGFAKDGFKHSRPVLKDTGEEVEVLQQEITIKNPDSMARFAQCIGHAYDIECPLVDALVAEADAADAERAENARILAEHKAHQEALAQEEATHGTITPEMVAEASKAELVKTLRDRGVAVNSRDSEAKVRDLANAELVNV